MVTGNYKNTRRFLVSVFCVLAIVLLLYRKLFTGIHPNISNHFNTDISNAITDRIQQFTNGSINYQKKEPPELIFTFTHDDAKEVAGKCKEKFNDTFEENLKVVQNYPTGMAEFYFPFLEINKTGPAEIPEYPVIVTGFNEAFYATAQGLFRSIHILNATAQCKGKIRCLVYDLGLKESTLDTVKSKSRCEVRHFPFGEVPVHVKDLKTYAFKPIIVQMALLEFGSVWWTDSMIRVNATHLDLAVEYLKKFGWIFMTTKSNRNSFSLAKQTDKGMFKFLAEDPCKFRPYGEIWACTTLFYLNDVTRSVVKAWVSCALNKACIAPKGARLICRGYNQNDGRCHRYDQSMLGIIARRLFHEQHQYPLDERVRSIYREGRGEVINYF